VSATVTAVLVAGAALLLLLLPAYAATQQRHCRVGTSAVVLPPLQPRRSCCCRPSSCTLGSHPGCQLYLPGLTCCRTAGGKWGTQQSCRFVGAGRRTLVMTAAAAAPVLCTPCCLTVCMAVRPR
jgi:hypothetical protein